MGILENVTCVEEMLNSCRVWVGNPERKSHLEGLVIDLKAIGKRVMLQVVLNCVVRTFVL
jgi:hypothetical protein